MDRSIREDHGPAKYRHPGAGFTRGLALCDFFLILVSYLGQVDEGGL